jgi:hypothetical protein
MSGGTMPNPAFWPVKATTTSSPERSSAEKQMAQLFRQWRSIQEGSLSQSFCAARSSHAALSSSLQEALSHVASTVVVVSVLVLLQDSSEIARTVK